MLVAQVELLKTDCTCFWLLDAEQTPHTFSYQRPARQEQERETCTPPRRHLEPLHRTWLGRRRRQKEPEPFPRAEEGDPLPRGRLAGGAVGRV